jgi:hypothetical protein
MDRPRRAGIATLTTTTTTGSWLMVQNFGHRYFAGVFLCPVVMSGGDFGDSGRTGVVLTDIISINKQFLLFCRSSREINP